MSRHSPETARAALRALLGRIPDKSGPVTELEKKCHSRDSYAVEELVLDLNGREPVPAVLVHPHTPGPWPVVLYNHAHGGEYHIGKTELLSGRSSLQPRPYADELTGAGYAALCIDHWAFGERAHRSEMDLFKEMLWHGQVMWGMMVFDSIRALDYLCARSDMHHNRIATMGISMGSTMAWWVAALDKRVEVCVDICCLTGFSALLEHNGLRGHGIYYFVPDLLTHFSTSSINALIAPRPHLACEGALDPLTPRDGLNAVDVDLKREYQKYSRPEAWELFVEECGHEETPGMRRKVIDWLRRWL